MTFGLTVDGFVLKRLSDIVTEIVADLTAVYGPIDTSPESVIGQIVGVFAEREANIWELMEAVYYSMYPASAEGTSLDGVVQLVGLLRTAAAKSEVHGAVTGIEGTVVADGSTVGIEGTGDIFEAIGDIEITKDVCIIATVGIQSGLTGADYTVQWNGNSTTVTGGVGGLALTPTDAQVVDAFVIAISLTAGFTIADIGDYFTITSDDYHTAFQIDSILNTDIASVTVHLHFLAQLTGPKQVPIGTLINILTPITGWTSVTNYIVGIDGRDVETDTELRIRRNLSLAVIGAGTVDAIKARLENDVDGVLAAFVNENRTDVTDGAGLPPHSFQAVVDGGTDEDIGNKIWETKPAGIQTYGSESYNVVDSQGDTQVMYFDRPAQQLAYVEVDIDRTGSEETFPTDGLVTIKANVLAYGNTFGIGQDIIIQKFIGVVYEIPGITTVVVRIKIGGAPGAGDIVNIAIGGSEIASYADARITINDVTP